MKKRVFSILLTLCMVLTLFPVSALAVEGKSEAVVCTCEAACAAEDMNAECPVCGAEGAAAESCGKYAAPEAPAEAEPKQTAVEKVQALIDALPDADTITAENRAEVEAQLTAIDDAKFPLEDEWDALDFGKYDAAVAAINVLDNQPGAEVPKTMEADSLDGATVNVTKTFSYNGTPQTLTASDVTVTLADGTTLASDTDYTVTATAQTVPGNYPFTVTGTGNYTGEITGSWKIGKGKLDAKYKTIHLKLKKGGDPITFDAADMLPDMGAWRNINPSQSRGVALRTDVTLVTVSLLENAGDDLMARLIVYSDYYENSYIELQIEKVESLDSGNACSLTVTMADWDAGDKPNKPTITGLPETPYNYRVTYAKKGDTASVGAPSNGGQYTVTVSCMDAENNTYTGSADFSVWMTVTFDPNGGALPTGTAAKVRINVETLDSLPVPTWTGHTFLGWFTEKTEGTQVDKDTVYTGNTTLYARWETNTYTISFDSNGGTVDPTSATTDAYGKLTELPTPTRSGSYRFDGWFTEKNGGTAVTVDTVYEAHTTVYAHWTYTGSTTPDYVIEASAGGGGSISPEGEVSVRQGRNQTFEIKAKSGYVVKDVKVDGKSVGAVESYTFHNVSSDHTIQVTFKKGSNSQYVIKATAGEGGKITPAGEISVRRGEDKTFKIKANSGYAIVDVKVDGKSVGAVKSYTFKDVSSDHTIHVVFMNAKGNPQTGVDVSGKVR